MRIPIEVLIDGVMNALREEVLPDLPSSRARSRLWAVLDVLNNLRDRVEEKALFLRMEAESAEEALHACAAALRASGLGAEGAAILASTDAALSSSSDERERCAALREVLIATLRRIEATASTDAANAARRPLELHLGSQALRDVMILKPSLLNEISKG
jgi:hypothetical protein